jgi:hypothetical protein
MKLPGPVFEIRVCRSATNRCERLDQTPAMLDDLPLFRRQITDVMTLKCLQVWGWQFSGREVQFPEFVVAQNLMQHEFPFNTGVVFQGDQGIDLGLPDNPPDPSVGEPFGAHTDSNGSHVRTPFG